MGLFDKFTTQSEDMTPLEGVVGVVMSAVAADGVVTADEVQSLGVSLSRMNLFRDAKERDVQRSFERVTRIAEAEGAEVLLERASGAVPEELKATTFAIAADIVFADGEVTPEERDFLERIHQTLGVDQGVALKIVDVMQIKNKG